MRPLREEAGRRFLLAVAVGVTCWASFASAQPCTLSDEEKARLTALSFEQFDQAPEGGWRIYGQRKCYALAAAILDRYHALHGPALQTWQAKLLRWHAGQMYAFDNDYTRAKERFQDSYDPAEAADAPLLWNDYVSATLAFLNKDEKQLRLHRDRIASGPMVDGERLNLDVVTGLVKCFDKPYSVAYSDESCRRP